MKKVTMTKNFTIGSLSKKTDVNIETIRYYEKIGVMPQPQRSEGGNRLYDTEQVKRLLFIRRSRELGFSIEAIRELLNLVDKKAYTCAEIANLSQKHLDGVRSKIKDLLKIEGHMQDMLSQCNKNSMPECFIIDALFEVPDKKE